MPPASETRLPSDKPNVLEFRRLLVIFLGMHTLRWMTFALMLGTCLEVHGVVVAGANGGGNTSNNTTAVQMAAQLGLTNTAFYGNVLGYSDAGSIYLGWANTAQGPRAFALSATHINPASFMDINGLTYSVSSQSILGSDVTLLTLTQSNNLMPVLPVVSLANTTPGIGTGIIMAGFGRNRVQDATTSSNTPDSIILTNGTGYTTTAPSLLRWGTNVTIAAGFGPPSPVTTTNIGTNPTVIFMTQFDQPATGEWLTSNEAQAVLGDSGGGAFDANGNLLGIIAAVTGSITNPVFGGRTYFSDIATYKNEIDNAIGYTLVPEPSTTALVLVGAGVAALFAFRRRR